MKIHASAGKYNGDIRDVVGKLTMQAHDTADSVLLSEIYKVLTGQDGDRMFVIRSGKLYIAEAL